MHKTLDPEEYVDPKNPRPVSTVTAAFTLPGRNQSYYSLTDEELKTFTAVVIGEGGTNKDSVFWTASAMFNRIDIKSPSPFTVYYICTFYLFTYHLGRCIMAKKN